MVFIFPHSSLKLHSLLTNHPQSRTFILTRFNMFLTLKHTELHAYKASRAFVHDCYQLTNQLPSEERFSMVSQIRRAALSVHLNISEGASRKSAMERKRYFEIARGSCIEIDAALDIASDLGYLDPIDTARLGSSMTLCFKLLSGLIHAIEK